MKHLFFPDAYIKSYTLGQIVKMEDERDALVSRKQQLDSILQIAAHREELVKMWDDMTIEQRAHAGDTKGPGISPITFKNVANQSFADLPSFWKGAWLTGMSHSLESAPTSALAGDGSGDNTLPNGPDSFSVQQQAGTKANMEAQS